MDSDDDVPDTRVFVSGLPPKYTSPQLGAHFAGRYQITDAVVLPGRQIGFVGFRNYTLAKNAIKYFDKTYIRMSKISVSFAKPVELAGDSHGKSAPASRHEQRVTAHLVPSDKVDGEPQSTNGTSRAGQRDTFTPYKPVAQVQNRKRKVDDVEADNLVHGSRSGNFTASDRNGSEKEREELKGKRLTSQEETSDREDETPVSREDELTKTTSKDGKEKKKKKKKQEGEEAALALEAKERDAEDHTKASTEDRESRKKRKADKRAKLLEGAKLTEDAKNSSEELHADVALDTAMKSKKRKETKHSASDKNQREGAVYPSDDEMTPAQANEGADTSQQPHPASDMDWLRTRTSRTLDIVDEPSEKPKTTEAKVDDVSTLDNAINNDVNNANPIEGTASSTPQITNGRLFVRNLPYDVTEDSLTTLFKKHGKLEEVHILRDFKTSNGKGLAYIQYVEPPSAVEAMTKLDGKSFQGRLLHVLAASDKRDTKLREFEISKLPLKKQKAMKRRTEDGKSTFNWNSLYMNPDAVLSSVASNLGVSKGEILDPTSSDAAVKQALAETEVIQKTKASLEKNGINLQAFSNSQRDDKTLLLKNFSFGTTVQELRDLASGYGEILRLIMPATGTMAVLQYAEPGYARAARKQLAYRNLHGSPLYIEKAPIGLFDKSSPETSSTITSIPPVTSNNSATPDVHSSTLFIKNLNFTTSTKRLAEVFSPIQGYLSAKVKTRQDPKRPNELLSMGFGFVEFKSQTEAQAARTAMDGMSIDGHRIQAQIAQQANDLAQERRNEDQGKKDRAKGSKLIIKNLPFEASRKDVKQLFSTYGQLKTIRLPKKFDNSTRGFAFAEFVSAKEAENAMSSLQNTHILGRRLVLEYAEGDMADPEKEIEAIEKKMGQQTGAMRLNDLTGSDRHKFNLDAQEDGLV